MAKNEQPKPKDILEALGPRAKADQDGKIEVDVMNPPDEPEPTTEEHVAEALSGAGLIDRLESEQYPEGAIPMQQKKTISNPPAMEKQIIPASNIVPPPAAKTSTRESQEQLPLTEEILRQAIKDIDAQNAMDENLRRLKEYVNGELYSVNWVRLHLLHVSRIQQALPSPTLWAIPGNLDVAKLVYDVVLSPGYVETKWPILQILLGPSIDNIEWGIGVLTTLALFDAINLLPYQKRIE